MLSQLLRRRVSRVILALAIATPVCGASWSASAAAASVSATPAVLFAEGVCAFAGTLQEGFDSPPLSFLPTTSNIALNGSGTCATNGGLETIYVNLSGSGIALSCGGGLGSMGGNVSFSLGTPPPTGVVAQYVGGPFSEELTITAPSNTFVASAQLAWVPTSDPGCVSGLSSTPVAGTLEFEYG